MSASARPAPPLRTQAGRDPADSPARIAALASHYVDVICVQARRLRAIPRLATAADGDLERFLEVLCAEVPDLFDADGVALFLDDGHGTLRVRALAGMGETFAHRATLTLPDLAALDEQHGPVARLDAESARPWPELLQGGLRNLLFAHIRWRGRAAGGLLVGTRDDVRAFSDDDMLYAEVLATFVGARLGELSLQRNVAKLQRALWETARRAALVERGAVAPKSGVIGKTSVVTKSRARSGRARRARERSRACRASGGGGRRAGSRTRCSLK
jgi:hypothetical protein